MLRPLLTAAVLCWAAPIKADDVSCLARIIHGEARGESVEGAATLGQSAVELAKTLKMSLCRLEQSGQVHSKPIPTPLASVFLAIARSAINDPRLLNKGADHWDRGRPHMPGKIKRVVGKHTFYTLRD